MSSSKGTPFTAAQASAVATDYTANIAAAVQILGTTWNSLQRLTPQMTVNNGSSQYIENWYYAIWGYNSGVYNDPGLNGGHTGLGWANNPANPAYNPTRLPFMRDSSADAADPGNWPYQEKVLGWAENPQVTYGSAESYTNANYAPGQCNDVTAICDLTLPTDYLMFCSPTVNTGCNPNTTGTTSDGKQSHCPATDATCWWNQPVSWISGNEASQAAVENLSYALGSPEPAMNSEYGAPDCAYPDFRTSEGGSPTFVIGTLPDSGQNIFGCPTKVLDGKFSLRLGDNFAGTEEGENGLVLRNPLIAQIDLHQLGAGWMGHIFFTHSYPDGTQEATAPAYSDKVTAAWTPDPAIFPTTGQDYDIRVHLPSHGGNVSDANYYVQQGTGTAGDEATAGCIVNQSTGGTDEWLDLGVAELYPGARVLLSNLTPDGDGSSDVAFDAVAFTAVSSGSWCPNGKNG
jgi:hypothetical protein